MERSERQRLEGIQRRLNDASKFVADLLKRAERPRLRSQREVTKRVQSILQDVRSGKGTVTQQQLRSIVTKHGMPFTAVGALYAGGYLTKTKTGATLGPRSRLKSKAA